MLELRTIEHEMINRLEPSGLFAFFVCVKVGIVETRSFCCFGTVLCMISNAPPLFIKVTVPSQKSEWSCICVIRV